MEAYALEESVRDLYHGRTTTGENSGFDLYLPYEITFPAGQVTFVHYGIQMTTMFGGGFYMYPRSSISRTPLRMANSVGIIDQNYRGSLISAIENTSSSDITLPRGTRLVQVCMANLMPFNVTWTAEPLGPTSRGDGGFGSTGR